MNWGKFIMEVMVAALITGVFGVIAVLTTNMFVDKRGYDKIDRKIGYLNNETLTKQHENISNNISYNAKNLEKIQDKEFNRIYTKVDKINEVTVKNEGLYQNLNVDQKEVRNNVNKLVLDWEKTISENKDLKSQIEVFKSKKQELKIDNEKIKEELNKIISNNESMMKENVNFKAENKAITEQLNKIDLENNKIISENTNLKEENKETKLENKTIKTELDKLRLSMDKTKLNVENLTVKNTNLNDKNKKLNEKLLLAEQLLNLQGKTKDRNSKERNQEQDDELEL